TRRRTFQRGTPAALSRARVALSVVQSYWRHRRRCVRAPPASIARHTRCVMTERRPPSSMRIQLSDARRAHLIDAIRAQYRLPFDEDLSGVRAAGVGQLLGTALG